MRVSRGHVQVAKDKPGALRPAIAKPNLSLELANRVGTFHAPLSLPRLVLPVVRQNKCVEMRRKQARTQTPSFSTMLQMYVPIIVRFPIKLQAEGSRNRGLRCFVGWIDAIVIVEDTGTGTRWNWVVVAALVTDEVPGAVFEYIYKRLKKRIVCE